MGYIEFGTKRQLNQESPYRVSYEDYPDRILHALQLRGYEAENCHSTWNIWDDAEKSIGGVFINVANLLTKLGKLAGVLPNRDLTPHVLRASKLTHMHDEGTSVDDIHRFADHADASTTLRYIRRRDDSTLKARHAQAAATVYETLLDRWA